MISMIAEVQLESTGMGIEPLPPVAGNKVVPDAAAGAGIQAPAQPIIPPRFPVLSDEERLDTALDTLPPPDVKLPVEHYIPFRDVVLKDLLVRDFPRTFASGSTLGQFSSLCRWLSARNSLRLLLAYEQVKDTYALLDPDNDSEQPTTMTQPDKQTSQAQFEMEMLSVLDKGAFDDVTEEQLASSSSSHGVRGIIMEPCDSNIVKYKFWYRGTRPKKYKYRSWRTFFREKEVETQVLQRVVLLFKSAPEAAIEAYLADKQRKTWGRWLWSTCGCCFRCFKSKGIALTKLAKLEPGYVYLKLFKEMELADLDMLLPGAKAKFSWLDFCLIWIPIFVGVGMAIWKAATGTIQFNSLMDALLSLVLIVMPLTWGLKAYLAVKDKMAEYQAHLNDLSLTHLLDSNAGAVTGVLAEAQEQEDNEAMLAYFFLWRGLKNPTPVCRQQLDLSVESYLTRLMQEVQLKIRLDFQVEDGIKKLQSMGLLTSSTDVFGQEMLRVLPLEHAVQQANVANFDEKKEVASAKAFGRLSMAAMASLAPEFKWRECESAIPETGQKCRYWWNSATGQSTYQMPEVYYALNSSVVGTMTVRGSAPSLPLVSHRSAQYAVPADKPGP